VIESPVLSDQNDDLFDRALGVGPVTITILTVGVRWSGREASDASSLPACIVLSC